MQLSMLRCFLDVADPDAIPCHLALLVLKPCHEVFIQRSLVISDVVSCEDSDEEIDVSDFEDSFMGLRKRPHPGPCSHAGPCRRPAVCTCRAANYHCLPQCNCGPACERQWKGCSCKPGKNCEKGSDCTCSQNRRECIIGLCSCCEEVVPGQINCDNVHLQISRAAHLEIKKGIYGLGAFATENIVKGRFIGEYVGEINISEWEDHKIFIRKHIGLNYSFGFNDDDDLPDFSYIELDSARVGNETRYINHAENANTIAKYIFSRGDMRIGIFASDRIEKGKELYLDYGTAYFNR